MGFEQKVIDQFFAKTTTDHDEWFDGSKCVLWTASTGTRSGRGRFADGARRFWTAPQFAYVLEHGSLPDGMVVWQNCGNVLCVNHLHLEAVDRDECGRRAHLRVKPLSALRCCGRPKTPDNVYPCGRCKHCQAKATKRWLARKKSSNQGKGRPAFQG